MPKFRKKPVVISAVQWSGLGSMPALVEQVRHTAPDRPCDHCGVRITDHGWVETLEGGHIVCPGDWIIQGVNGEFYPCKPDIFEKTYEAVE